MTENISKEAFEKEAEKRKRAEAGLCEYVDKFNDLAEACSET